MASNALRRSSVQLYSLVDSIPVGAVLLTENGDIDYANAEACRILGCRANELLGRTVAQLFQSDNTTCIFEYIRHPQRLTPELSERFFTELRCGRELPVKIGLQSLGHSDRSWAILTFVDMSPLVRANEMFQQSVRVAPHGILVIDEAGKIRLVNRYIQQCFGYTDDELIGEPVEKLLPERHRHHHTSLRNAYYKTPTVRMMGPGRDLTALHKDGREFPVEIGLSTFDDSAQQKRVLVSLVDITERKKMEMEMREINTNLEEFTYVVSHDLRSPLRGISDLIQWIEEDIGPDPPPEVTHNIDRINIRVERMESLIDNLLAYARAGSACRELKRIDMAELLQEVCDFVQIPEQFEMDMYVEPGVMISARTPLETVLRNLISNAIKHHDQAAGKLVVTSVMEHNMCRIAVRDDGPGIPPNMHDRIFRLFQTVTASERQGTGIGLSVSRRLVETHGGRISVQANTPDRGSTFSVWWPRFVRKDTYD